MESSQAPLIRKANHAGSWYKDRPTELKADIANFLSPSDILITDLRPSSHTLRGLISPHAGFRYSGPTAGYAFRHLLPRIAGYKRVIVMGPSHKVYMDFVGTTKCDKWATPLGDIDIDMDTVKELAALKDPNGDGYLF
jgi:AmmeMemoRadiSam system protein B